MKQVRQGKLTYLRPDWAEKHHFQGGFTTRNGGLSRPPYNSLNLGLHTDDLRPSVEGNRATLARAFELAPHQLLTVRQVHGTDVLILDEANPELSHFQGVEADAIISNQPGMMFGVLVADCYPVLLWDAQRRVAATVHVGWRGAAAGIIDRTIKAMSLHFGTQAAELLAAIGPGIDARHYEVDRPVRQAFEEGSGHWAQIAREAGIGHWQLDLRASCRLQLEAAGLRSYHIDQCEENTVDQKELFFSYRRDGGKSGRQLGFVVLA